MLQFVDYINNELRMLEGLDAREIKGCSDKEIVELQNTHPFSVKLPYGYTCFLKKFGKQVAFMAPVTNFFYQEILRAWKDPDNCLRLYDQDFFHRMFVPLSDPRLTFPENAFAFTAHLGYQYRFFICDNELDPLTYFIQMDPKGRGFTPGVRYSELITSYFDEFIGHYKNLQKQKCDVFDDFIQLKALYLDFLDLLEQYKCFGDRIENFTSVMGYYQQIEIYDVLKGEPVFLGAFYDIKIKEGAGTDAIDAYNIIIQAAKELKKFYANKFF